MALTVTPIDSALLGRFSVHVYTVTFDASYPALGYAVTPALLGLNSIIAVQPTAAAAPAGAAGVTVIWDQTNSKLRCFEAEVTALSTPAALVEVATGASLAGITTQVVVYGRGI